MIFSSRKFRSYHCPTQMKKIIPFLVFILIALGVIRLWTKDDHPYQLSILAIFQNEERFLKEWIDFHRALGVEHFYLFNNLSSDDYLKVLQPYRDAGIVELHDWPYASKPGNEPDWTRIQSAAYRTGLAHALGQTKWLAILDTDEFLFPTHASNLIEWLSSYGECSGILVNWQVFGTSHVKRIPSDSFLIENLLLQAPENERMNTYCKSIIRPETVKYCNDPHTVVYYPWSYSVDPDKRIFRWKFHEFHSVKIDKIRINHYWSRDEDFLYKEKLARYEKWGMESLKKCCLDRNRLANQIPNTEILRFMPLLYRLQEEDL